MNLRPFSRRSRTKDSNNSSGSDYTNSPSPYKRPSESTNVEDSTRTRRISAFLSSAFFFVALIFLILVEIGGTNANRPVLGSIYFLKLNCSQVIPRSVPQARLINSIARTIGLHDFYQVSLWGYCEGYDSQITHCSDPQALYWFNPVQIIISQLFSGATIALPTNIIDILDIIRLASHWMFALFMTGACTNFVAIFIAPLSVYSRWASLPLGIFSFLAALTTTAASIIGTAMFVIFRDKLKQAEDIVNIKASLGSKMFAFMWIASIFSIIAFMLQLSLCCCCTSRRDVKRAARKRRWRLRQSNMAQEKEV